ncbi:Adaptive-response sensory-kinase SasA [Cellulomonas sp. T2.31MG-18]|jgi:histidine kinase|uniref:sensor histidine kinase n=1 Tax=Cellulomonas sp. T2.31MG-18 TaxID=3157619 RepID=UPI0035EA73B1
MSRLSTRALISHTLVAVTGAVTAYLVSRELTPRFYDSRMAGMMGQMLGPGGMSRDLAVGAANRGLAIGVLVALAVAIIAGAWSSWRLLRPLDDLSAAAHRIAAGRYDEPVPLPREAELARVANDVNALAARLAETEARRMRLLGEVAHEMRTPLTVLDGYVEGLQDGVFTPEPELYAELSGELRRLRRLSEDLGALSRAEEGRLGLHVARVDVAAVAIAAAERLRPQLHDAGLDLKTEWPRWALLVDGDADRIAQVVTNLVGNALAATPPGGHVRVVASPDGADALIEVSDTGIGLAEGDAERVFERFYRVPRTGTGPNASGSGIGLTIARGIAQAHGGSLFATSPGLDRGSTFTLRLPMARA